MTRETPMFVKLLVDDTVALKTWALGGETSTS